MMPRPVATSAAATLAVILIANAGCRKKTPPPPHVRINGHTWSVELAVTPEQQYEGLAGRTALADDAGMLFIYPNEEVRDFCMRGCVIPLDAAFINSRMRVVRTYTMEVEPDLAGRTVYSSTEPAQFVLEVAGGALARAGVRIGDEVTLSGDIRYAAKAAPGR